jgi:hypothetical protein
VPDFVDKSAMVQKWQTTHQSNVSGDVAKQSGFEIIPNGNHELADER